MLLLLISNKLLYCHCDLELGLRIKLTFWLESACIKLSHSWNFLSPDSTPFIYPALFLDFFRLVKALIYSQSSTTISPFSVSINHLANSTLHLSAFHLSTTSTNNSFFIPLHASTQFSKCSKFSSSTSHTTQILKFWTPCYPLC